MPSRKRRTKQEPRQRSALYRLGNGLLSASWLAAIVVVPLFFNPRTERVFEPDKLAWVVVLALVAVVAFVLRFTEPPFGLRVSRQPLVWSIGLALGALIVGALVSQVPAVSWFGLYRRGMGVIVYAAFVVLCAGVAYTARRPGMLDLWVKLTVLTTIPVSLYALMQRFGIDNVVWTGTGLDPTVRPFGPMGNPIFVGAYLVMAMPVAVVAILQGVMRVREGRTGSRPQLVVAIVAAGTVVATLAATQSRGPVLSLLVGGAMFALMWAAVQGRKHVAFGVVGIGALVLAALLIVGRGETDGGSRLAGLLSPGSRTAQERILLWGALGELARSDVTRAIIGYGPETTGYVVAPHVPEQLARLAPNQVFDRAHNTVLEWWISSGAIGLLALAALYVTAFLAALTRAGLVSRPNDRVWLVALLVGGTVLGVIVPSLVGVGAYIPIAAPFGMLAGLAVYLVWTSIRSSDQVGTAHHERATRLITIALVSALTAHLVESSVGLPTATSQLLLWIYLGLVVAISASPSHDVEASGDHAATSSSDGATPALAGAALGGLALATVAFAPLLVPSRDGPLGNVWLWLLPLVTWVAAEALSADETRSRWSTAARLVVPALLVMLLIVTEPVVGGASVAFAITVVVTTAAVGLVLSGRLRDRTTGEPWRWLVVASTVIVALVAAWRLAVVPVVADAHIRAGLEAVARRQSQTALGLFGDAAALWPGQPAYATYLGAAYRDMSVDPAMANDEREAAFQAAESVLADAYATAPDVALLRRLATLYRDRADAETDLDERQTQLSASVGHLDRALARWPLNSTTIAEKAATLERLGHTGAARTLYEQAFALGGTDAAWLVGHARTALTAAEPEAAESSIATAFLLAPEQPESVGRLVDEAAHLGVPLPGAVGTQILYLVLTDRPDEADRLYAAVVEQAPTTPGLDALGAWLETR